MVGIRTFLRRTWGRVWIYSFFALLPMIALSFIQHVIGGINWEAFQYPAEDGKPNVFVDDINHPSELTSLLVGDNHLYLFYGTTLIISKKPRNTGISRDIRTEFTTDLLLSD